MSYLRFKGSAYSDSIFTNHYSGEQLSSLMSQSFAANGWGVTDVQVATNWFDLGGNPPFVFQITINIPKNENVERVKIGLTNAITAIGGLKDIGLNLTYDSRNPFRNALSGNDSTIVLAGAAIGIVALILYTRK